MRGRAQGQRWQESPGLLGRLPARLTAEQTAWMLNCQPHNVPVLVAARLLKPLGNPLPNGVKYFATADVLVWMSDRAWLAKVTSAVSQFWQKKNAHKKGHSHNGAENGQAALPVMVND